MESGRVRLTDHGEVRELDGVGKGRRDRLCGDALAAAEQAERGEEELSRADEGRLEAHAPKHVVLQLDKQVVGPQGPIFDLQVPQKTLERRQRRHLVEEVYEGLAQLEAAELHLEYQVEARDRDVGEDALVREGGVQAGQRILKQNDGLLTEELLHPVVVHHLNSTAQD